MTPERAKELCRTIAQDWYDSDESLLALTDRIVAVVLLACREQKRADIEIVHGFDSAHSSVTDRIISAIVRSKT